MSSYTELQVFEFQVSATASGFPTVRKSAPGTMQARAETVSVVSVIATPPFADAGGVIAVSARVLNAVNRQQDALASFEVRDPNGNIVFTSTPVPFTLTVVTSLVTENLGTFDTTGFANGEYTVIATIADAGGTPIIGAIKDGRVLVGSPVTGSVAVEPETLPPGTSVVTNTLVIENRSTQLDPPRAVGVATVAGANDAIRNGDYVYVASRTGTSSGISVFNIAGANLNNPQLVRVVGIVTGTDLLKIRGNLLVAVRGGNDGINVPNSTRLDTYSLTDPANPQFLGTTGELPFSAAADLMLTDTHAFIVHINLHSFFGFTVFSQPGSVIAVNITNPAAPFFDGDAVSASGTPEGRDGVNDGLLFNDYGTNIDGLSSNGLVDESGGNRTTWAIVQASPTIAYVTGSSSTGGDTQTGIGLVHVVDISDPQNMRVIRDLQIPGTVHVVAIRVVGDKAFITASEGGWHQNSFEQRFTGNAVLATLDISDPANPQIIHSQVLAETALGIGRSQIVPFGGDLFAYGNQGANATDPGLFVFNANDPNNLSFVGLDIPSEIFRMSGGGNLLFTADRSSLIIYEIVASPSIPVTAQVQIPNNTGVEVVAGSFNVPPTDIIVGAGFNTLVWESSLTAANPTRNFSWQTIVTALQPGESRAVTLDTTIDFTSQGTAGRVTLPPQNVFAEQVLALDPAERTVRPGEAASFTVTIANPAQVRVTYDLSVVGIPREWVDFPTQVTVSAGGSTDVTLVITSDPFAPLAEFGFVVTANVNGTSGSVEGMLTLAGDPVLPQADPDAHGVVLSVSPNQTTAGQGTAANYVARVTNTGSVTDTFDLSLAGLPAGFTATFGQNKLQVPPGASNFREVPLAIVAPPGTVPGDYAFTVTASSETEANLGDDANGLVTVLAIGVDVEITPTTGVPGSTFQMRVTNTGQVSETFDLSVAAPAALVATLGTTSLSLAPGQSQLVPIDVGAIDFAFPGALMLVGVATSQTNSAVLDADSADVNIAGVLGMTAAFDDDSIELSQPGNAAFLLLVDNLGNLEDEYTATIMGMTGPITASLSGLDGQPTQTVPLFRLPGLSTGAILVNASLVQPGRGTVTVVVRSRTNGAIIASDTGVLGALDVTAPIIDQPQNQTAEATGPTGAVVVFTPPAATDDVDGVVVVNCTPPSGATFPLGLTTVACSATDSSGNPAQRTFDVRVEDTTPPSLTQPVDRTVEATSAAGAAVSFTLPVARDLVDQTVVVACNRVSGSLFPIGTTTVTCTGTDDSGTSATVSFNVMVEEPEPPTGCSEKLVASSIVPGSGNVTAQSNAGRLTITGDKLLNNIRIEAGLTPNSLCIIGDLGTTVNGRVGSELFTGVTSVFVAMRGSSDSLFFDGSTRPITLHGDLNIRMNSTRDTLRLDHLTVERKTRIRTGRGRDLVELVDTVLTGKSSIFTGRGNDTMRVHNSQFLSDILFDGYLGTDSLDAGTRRRPNSNGNLFARSPRVAFESLLS